MCREFYLDDIRTALADSCDDVDQIVRCFAEDSFDDSDDPLPAPHAADHRRRADWLAGSGDDGAAFVHEALAANLVRAELAG